MIHVIIKTERRKDRLALPMNADIRTPNGKTVNGMPQFDVTLQPPQLHTMGAVINDMSNIEYAAEWDGVSPWVNVLVGNIASLNMRFLGWPDLTKEDWDAANPVKPFTL